MAVSSTSLFFSPLAQDSCREGSSSTLIADSTTTRFTFPFLGERQQFTCGLPDGAWVEEQGGDAFQEGAIVSGRPQLPRPQRAGRRHAGCG
jgi:hypothetical protein